MFTLADAQKTFGVGWINSGQLKVVNVGRALSVECPRWRSAEAALLASELARTAGVPAPRTGARRKRAGDVIGFV